MNTRYDDFIRYESNGIVRICPSDADKAYIYGGSLGKAFKTVLPVIILSLALIIGTLLAKHYLLTNEGFGPFLFYALLAAGGIALVGSVWSLLKIRDEEEVRRSIETMIKNKRKYNQLHRGNPPTPIGRPYLNVRDAEIILTLNPTERG